MKFYYTQFVFLVSTSSLLTINFAFSLPVKAAISCVNGSISRYQNGSLASCILDSNTQIQLSNSKIGTSIFPCKSKNYISFKEDGNFQSCQLTEAIQIRTGNAVKTCPTEYIVSVDISKDGNLSISCRGLGY